MVTVGIVPCHAAISSRGCIGAVRAQGVHVTALYTLTSSWAQDGQVGGIFSMDCFPVLLRLKPLCFAQKVLEQPEPFSADALLELGESFLHRARLVELFRLAKFDAVNQRELDHALEIDLWELFPHDQSRRKSSLSLLRDPSGRPGPPEKPLQPAAAFDDVFAIFAI